MLFRKIIIIVLFLLIFVAIGVFYFKKGIKINKDNRDTNFDQSAFSSVLKEDFLGLTETLQIIFLDNDEIYWNDWNWQEKMVRLYITDLDLHNNDLFVQFQRPYNHKYNDEVRRVDVQCKEEETVAVSGENPTQNLLAGGFNIFEKVVVGDFLFSFCLTEECLAIGKSCILVRLPSE